MGYSTPELALWRGSPSCRYNGGDTVVWTPERQNYASHVPSLKAQKSREANAVTAAVSHGNRMTNTIRSFHLHTVRGPLLVVLRIRPTLPPSPGKHNVTFFYHTRPVRRIRPRRRFPAPPLPPPVSSLEESRARLGTSLVLLGGGAARPYCSDEFIALDDRHDTRRVASARPEWR